MHYPIWHPYTEQNAYITPTFITHAEGAYLFTKDGRRLIDMISSWWVNIHGHAHPYIAENIAKQARILEQVIFADFTHKPAIDLATVLMAQSNNHFHKVFFSDNGSTSVEVALKMAVQYWYNKGEKERNKILALTHAYHGDTFGAMSTSARGIFTTPFRPYLFDIDTISTPTTPPTTPLSLPDAPHRYACFIYEPMLQGAGGMLIHNVTALNEILAYCKANNILLIADEVLTAWGRTGTTFASDHTKHYPDIMCLSKGITGGFLPLGITLATKKIYQAFQEEKKETSPRTLFHGHSFCANPITCIAATAAITLFNQTECQENIQRISNAHRHFLTDLATIPIVRHPRSIGPTLAFEIATPYQQQAQTIHRQIQNYLLKKDIYLRPLANTLYLMPPYCISDNDLDKVYEAIKKMLKLPEFALK